MNSEPEQYRSPASSRHDALVWSGSEESLFCGSGLLHPPRSTRL